MDTQITIAKFHLEHDYKTYVNLLKELTISGLTFKVEQDSMKVMIILTGGY